MRVPKSPTVPLPPYMARLSYSAGSEVLRWSCNPRPLSIRRLSKGVRAAYQAFPLNIDVQWTTSRPAPSFSLRHTPTLNQQTGPKQLVLRSRSQILTLPTCIRYLSTCVLPLDSAQFEAWVERRVRVLRSIVAFSLRKLG